MPKLDGYDNTMWPMTPQVQMNVDQRVAAGGWSSKDDADKTRAIGEAAAVSAKGGAESTVENTNTDWINTKYRPMMGWTYMLICVTDFIIFPILWSVLQAIQGGSVTSQWSPLSLQGAGLLHLAFGAILGITSFGRSKEKVAGVA